jgi:hypothetical protein
LAAASFFADVMGQWPSTRNQSWHNWIALNKDGRGDTKEHAMTTHFLPVPLNRPTNDELHPLVYRSIIGLTIWLMLSAWLLFSRGEYEGLTLSVITLFFVILWHPGPSLAHLEA